KRRLEVERDFEAAGKEGHGAGGRHAQRQTCGVRNGSRRRDGAVSAASDQRLDTLRCRPLLQRRLDGASIDHATLERVAAFGEYGDRPSAQVIEIGGSERSAIAVEHGNDVQSILRPAQPCGVILTRSGSAMETVTPPPAGE